MCIEKIAHLCVLKNSTSINNEARLVYYSLLMAYISFILRSVSYITTISMTRKKVMVSKRNGYNLIHLLLYICIYYDWIIKLGVNDQKS